MKARAFVRLSAVCIALLGADEASAGVWRWGCAGPVGREHVVFNRYQMLRLPLAIDAKRLLEIIFLDDLRSDPAIAEVQPGDITVFTADDVNSGLVETMTFQHDDPPTAKLTLTEKASKTLSRHVVPGCRDQSTTRFRKVYRLEVEGEPARDVTLQCYDYTLSTRGGRPCD